MSPTFAAIKLPELFETTNPPVRLMDSLTLRDEDVFIASMSKEIVPFEDRIVEPVTSQVDSALKARELKNFIYNSSEVFVPKNCAEALLMYIPSP